MTRLSLPFLTLFSLRALAGSAFDDIHLIRRYNYLEDLPTCTYDCVVQFTSESFPSCQSSNLDCLCRSQSTSGFTLGEGALRCLASDCPDASSYLLEAVYSLCDDVSDAQPETHATIEASLPTWTTIDITAGAPCGPEPTTMATRTQSCNEPTHTSQSFSHSPTTSTSTSESIVLFTSTFPTHPFPTETNEATSSASAAGNVNASASADSQPTPAPILSKAQVVGIAVSGGVICAVAIGLIYCIFRSKKGKKRRDSDASFGVKGEYLSKTPRPENPPEAQEASLGVAPKARQFLGIPTNPAQKRWTLWHKAMRSNHQDEEQPQMAATPARTPFESSPVSIQSYQTTSRLLPDKPKLKAPWQAGPSRLRSDPPSQGRPNIDGTPRQPVRFANNVGLRIITPTPPHSQSSSSSGSWTEQNTSQSAMQGAQLRHQLSDPFIDKTMIASFPVPSSRRASNRDLPKIVTPDARAYPPPPQHSPIGSRQYQYQQQQSLPSRAPQNTQNNSAPYVSPRPVDPLSASAQPSSAGQQALSSADDSAGPFSKWRPLRHSSKSQRPLTHYTTGSETSFEDDGDQPEDTVPVSALSPVVESPVAQRSGYTSSVYYPPVPGPAPSTKRLQVTPQKAPQDQSQQMGQASSLSPSYRPLPRPLQIISPIELPSSSSGHTSFSSSKKSPKSSNFSRPQLQVPQPMPGPPRAPPKWQVMSSPGLNGEQETWSSPVGERRQRQPQLRPTIVEIRNEQRGPWRGRETPIGSQWHHARTQR